MTPEIRLDSAYSCQRPPGRLAVSPTLLMLVLIGSLMASASLALVPPGTKPPPAPRPPQPPGQPPLPGNVLVEISQLGLQKLVVRGFSLPAQQRLDIRGVGFQRSEVYGDLARAWILDSRSRRVVWEMSDARLVGRTRSTRRFADEPTLPAGDYELYYSTYPSSTFLLDKDLEWWDMVRSNGLDLDDYREAADELSITIGGKGTVRSMPSSGRLDDPRQVVGLLDPPLNRKRTVGFELAKATAVEIYALGEVTESGSFDYGWITDLASRKQVWTMSYEESEPAGGAKKNRRARVTLELPAGRYAAGFVTDDTHGPGKWNAQPPSDPFYWGLVVRVRDPAAKALVSSFEVGEQGNQDVIAEIIKVGDSEARTVGFTLKRPLQVRIYAMGEGSDDEMFDYGWLLDAKTRAKVWTMRYAATEPAGGASKNRSVDDLLTLPAGHYLLNYVSDGSHSYKDWNAAAPTDRDRWGITVYAADKSFDRKTMVAAYVEAEDVDTLVDLTRTRDDSHRKERFRLDRPTRLRITAVGEGVGGTMVDYGWIEDSRGRAVWEMTYRLTDPAGGASKNRMFDGALELPAGDYVAHFITDDSHAFGDFNAAAPHDPTGWGMRVSRAIP